MSGNVTQSAVAEHAASEMHDIEGEKAVVVGEPLKLPPEMCLGSVAYQEGSPSHEQRRPTALSVQPADQTTASTLLKAPIPRLVALLLCYCFHYILNRCLLLYRYSYCQNLLDHFNIISPVAFYLCLQKRRLWKTYTKKKEVHLLQSVSRVFSIIHHM